LKPTFAKKKPLPLAEYPPTDRDNRTLLNAVNSYVRKYALGECSVLVTREHGKWHLSIAHPGRYPTWDEVAEARYRLLPGSITAAMLLPPMAEYVNLHERCLHLYEIDDPEAKGVAR
jgi:hypothetical protein